MKKVLFFTLAIVLLFGFNSVYAEAGSEVVDGDSSVGANAIVGDVEENTQDYNVYIMWDRLVFDWKYDDTEGEYNWRVHPVCNPVMFSEIDSSEYGAEWYTDDECSVVATLPGSYTGDDNVYHYEEMAPYISIENDMNHDIGVSFSWQANQKYSFTNATFKYETYTCQVITNPVMGEDAYTTSNCTGDTVKITSNQTTYYGYITQEVTYTGGNLPAAAAHSMAGDLYCQYGPRNIYSVVPVLGLVPNAEVETPTSGETIGTITVTIDTN